MFIWGMGEGGKKGQKGSKILWREENLNDFTHYYFEFQSKK